MSGLGGYSSCASTRKPHCSRNQCRSRVDKASNHKRHTETDAFQLKTNPFPAPAVLHAAEVARGEVKLDVIDELGCGEGVRGSDGLGLRLDRASTANGLEDVPGCERNKLPTRQAAQLHAPSHPRPQPQSPSQPPQPPHPEDGALVLCVDVVVCALDQGGGELVGLEVAHHRLQLIHGLGLGGGALAAAPVLGVVGPEEGGRLGGGVCVCGAKTLALRGLPFA